MNIMLTGATGFVGSKLMLSLLDKGHTLYPVVRSRKKINQFIEKIPSDQTERIHPVEGDITQPDFGITEAESLNGKIDILYHTAAFLSFDPKDREKTFTANVDGTAHALELAEKLQIPALYHVSTAYTSGLSDIAAEEIHSTERAFVNDYEESKNHAEHIVWEKRNEMKISIFRPSIIVGDTSTGEADTTFALYGLLKAVALLKKLIARGRVSEDKMIKLLCDPEAANNVVPVNYVVDVLTAAADHAEAGTIYHISNNKAPDNATVMEWIREESGVENLSVTADAVDLSEEDAVINAPMSVFHSYLSRTVVFQDPNTKALLEAAGYPAFELTDQQYQMLISTYFKEN
ncbi:SDR family NAD(P)-dependent oxidoreductase [Jeotgalibacillus terrae]|uniref:SDR family NAD(P)-dependent oxidoreductase n=1 Tax=Jeotgalibacillus terrae TaxID=587735 RepID=A0ABW5ZIU5_9BACL|nr:SDR family NAD(P)-dependent oxidoreductase [Jeotgalibacillus terrae]MBM7580935.1 nucleoside-diphosphate-sugar epimerase [Jeotgalibacillus terrae]